MSETTRIYRAKNEWMTIDLNKPLPWWLKQPPLKERIMVHDERRKARGKAKRRKAG